MEKPMNISAAAKIANRDVSTIRRACQKNRIPGAFQLDDGTWLLYESGLKTWMETEEHHKTGRKAKKGES